MEASMGYAAVLQPKVVLWQKVLQFVQAVVVLSDSLPNNDFHQLRHRLRSIADDVPESLRIGFSQERKIDKMKSLIKAYGSLEECREYLGLVELLRYGSTRDLIKQIDELSKMLSLDSQDIEKIIS
jgi:four helix bundle protein